MRSIRDEQFIREKLGPVRLYRSNLLKILWAIQDEYRYIPRRFIHYLCDHAELTVEAIHSVISFYHFFSLEHRGDITIYLDTSATAEMQGYKEVKKAFEKALDISVGEVTSDMQFGLFETSCIGLSDQGPAAIINHQAATNLRPKEIPDLIEKLKYEAEDLPLPQTNLYRTGPVFFQPLDARNTIRDLLKLTPDEVLTKVKGSGLRGRGGAGFPTGTKWSFCREHQGQRYIFANADEGEPGTFKDRVLMQESPESLLVGMIIAGYALGSYSGYIYLRAEYFYLLETLEAAIVNLRRQGLLGQQILGSNFTFDIVIKFGAGAYICGEESALLESAEGKRGEPRNRPPFPVEEGYLGKPTVVNNVETLSALPMILNKGEEWYASLGTPKSNGTKLLSIAGDCNKPGVYEVEFGLGIGDMLTMVEANDVQAIQVGGPSGTLITPKEFDRYIGFEDLPTGGAITIFSQDRDMLKIVKNYAEFFREESCGFCVPCRAGNVIICEMLDKILDGKGVKRDLAKLEEISHVIVSSSRCGLGQTSPNPILQSLDKLSHCYDKVVDDEMEFITEFDLQESLRKAREGVA